MVNTDTFTNNKGYTLVSLLFFMIVSITIVSAAVMMIISSALSGSRLQKGENAYYIAESGIENALIRLLRDPSYTGETLAVGNGTVEITVTGSTPKIITAIGRDGQHRRQIEATVGYTNNILTVQNWKESTN